MIKHSLYVAVALAAASSLTAHGAIQVIYGDNPEDELDAQKVVELRNAYEQTIAEADAERRRREAALIDQANKERQQELNAERERAAKELERVRAELEEKQAQLDTFTAQRRHIGEEYRMAVDHTVKVINHQGDMPESLPPIATEGHDAPLIAAFRSVVPMDWQVYVHQDVDDDQSVSWFSDDKNWVAVLYQVGVRNNLAFDINWDDRWVLVNQSDLRLGLSESGNPEIEIMGHRVAPGTEGHIIIDGKVIRVRSTSR